MPELCGLDANGLFSDAVRFVVFADVVRLCKWTQRPVPGWHHPSLPEITMFGRLVRMQPACWGRLREGAKPLVASCSLQAAAATCLRGLSVPALPPRICANSAVCTCGASCASSRRMSSEYYSCTRTCGRRPGPSGSRYDTASVSAFHSRRHNASAGKLRLLHTTSSPDSAHHGNSRAMGPSRPPLAAAGVCPFMSASSWVKCRRWGPQELDVWATNALSAAGVSNLGLELLDQLPGTPGTAGLAPSLQVEVGSGSMDTLDSSAFLPAPAGSLAGAPLFGRPSPPCLHRSLLLTLPDTKLASHPGSWGYVSQSGTIRAGSSNALPSANECTTCLSVEIRS